MNKRMVFRFGVVLMFFTSMSKVLVPGVFSVGDIDKTDGITQAAALAEKF